MEDFVVLVAPFAMKWVIRDARWKHSIPMIVCELNATMDIQRISATQNLTRYAKNDWSLINSEFAIKLSTDVVADLQLRNHILSQNLDIVTMLVIMYTDLQIQDLECLVMIVITQNSEMNRVLVQSLLKICRRISREIKYKSLRRTIIMEIDKV